MCTLNDSHANTLGLINVISDHSQVYGLLLGLLLCTHYTVTEE